ncbi:dihydrolipoamide acetyltransferase family protein [Mucilaginibacter ginsenosidivorans]|uniref:Dihydrolipoamide acetyltransferase component of pyruvate dehydrogenase complex n=1 Tax=Mucilaginibacter ginsenosidivorans TaxID=398053 RepID=A0A5B8UZU0_9SPHI|nr:dihydrolipoamide acetyltransferase family protein [Mucilaginibacter ginsenosidivorans]QEC64285.1 2-oxo acid dehydrogenase subunit E2 [Mucilaginibacter ginsenosidivorans]
MAKYQLLLPKMGESVAEATIIKWNKAVGDRIEADETVMEIATDKVDSEVPSPVTGTLLEQLCNENDVVQVGGVIAVIETDEVEETTGLPQAAEVIQDIDKAVETPSEEPVSPEAVPGLEQLEAKETAVATGEEEAKGSGRFYSPLVKNIAAQEGLSIEELDKIPGTGAEGRLTKDDLLSYIQNPAAYKVAAGEEPVAEQPKEKPKPAATITEPVAEQKPAAAPAQPQPVAEPKAAPAISVSGGDEIIEMDRMRKLIADHMVMSKQTSPHVTSFVEADVTNIVQWREKVKGAFEKKEGEKITYTPIFIEAVVRAIKDMPMINISVNGTQIIKKSAINIGMATSLPSGNLIVPVIKKADELNLVGLTKSVNDLANRARNNKLQPDDVKDGTFTITNVGSFGNVMGTPIINQPQVAILAVGAIKKKPAVIETPQGDMIAIRHMMFLSLSYDHRVVDGALGGSFLRRIADYLEGWDINRAV